MNAHKPSATRFKSSKKFKVPKPKKEESETSESELGDSVRDEESEEHAGAADSEGSVSDNEKKSSNGNAAWADVMQKILKTNKPKRKKSIVLSKAKKLNQVKSKEIGEIVPFEIQTENGEVKREILPKKEKDEETNHSTVAKKKRKNVHLGLRVKPSIRDQEKERMLRKIATRGVVQLFNAVRQQQTDISQKLDQAGPLERKREKVLKSIDKRAFLDVLMGGTKTLYVDDQTKSTKVESTETTEDKKNDEVWSVLRDDFVMGAKLKDWDKKEPENDNESTSSEEMDSD